MDARRRILSLILLLTFSTANAGLLKVQGEISSSETVQAKLNDEIIVVNSSGAQVTTNSDLHKVISSTGLYAVDIEKEPDYKGTELSIQLKQGNKIYQLLQGENVAVFSFVEGGTFPVFKELNVTVGELVREIAEDSGSDDGDNEQVEESVDFNTSYDVDDDGKLTQADITAVKRALTKKNTRADVNNDGIINTRDIIDVIKAVRRQNRPR